MKLYYDMLVPYMPDAVLGDNGELIPNDQKAAGRNAMIELSKFQQSGGLNCLYHSVIYACTYAGVDLVDTIINLPEELNVPDGVTLTSVIDESAKNLFKSIKPSYQFDINSFVVNILTVAHIILENSAKQPTENPSVENIDEDSKQMNIDEVLGNENEKV